MPRPVFDAFDPIPLQAKHPMPRTQPTIAGSPRILIVRLSAIGDVIQQMPVELKL